VYATADQVGNVVSLSLPVLGAVLVLVLGGRRRPAAGAGVVRV